MPIPSAPQQASAGGSSGEIHAAALSAAQPKPGLTWLDVGCGTGEVLRAIRSAHSPSRLVGVDVIDWLDADLRDDVELWIGPAETTLSMAQPADRVLLIETIEHLEAPWTVLRIAAGLVSPGGRLVVSTPNVATLRHRIELAVRGELTSFRPGNHPHLGPILPHVTSRVLSEEGLEPNSPVFAGRDVVPKSGGRIWPAVICQRWSQALSISVVISAFRPSSATPRSARKA